MLVSLPVLVQMWLITCELHNCLGDLPGNPQGREADSGKFAALTRLQYQRFENWAGNDGFHLGDNERLPVPNTKLENLPVGDQPDQLTRAVLESTVGDPLYPGIETYWIAKLKETVGHDDTLFFSESY